MARELPAGWLFPTSTSRKEHWFADGENRSGCGRYGRFLLAKPDPAKPAQRKFVCLPCERKADAAAEKEKNDG